MQRLEAIQMDLHDKPSRTEMTRSCGALVEGLSVRLDGFGSKVDALSNGSANRTDDISKKSILTEVQAGSMLLQPFLID